MVEVLQYQQTLLDDLMALLSLDVGNKTHPAGVVLPGGVVQALDRGRSEGLRLGRGGRRGNRGHDFSSRSVKQVQGSNVMQRNIQDKGN